MIHDLEHTVFATIPVKVAAMSKQLSRAEDGHSAKKVMKYDCFMASRRQSEPRSFRGGLTE